MNRWIVIGIASLLTDIAFSASYPETDNFWDALKTTKESDYLPVQTLTEGPKGHWFSYYDKFQTDSTDRYALTMQVDFDGRSPKPDDAIKVGMIDLLDNNKWIELGQTRAWGWQQGCMLQWLPGSDSEVMWNDRQDGRFICRILNVKTNQMRTLPRAVYTVSPDGKWGLTLNFERVEYLRRGYGYAGLDDPTKDQTAPKEAGIFRVNMRTGDSEFLISIADIVQVPYSPAHPEDMHYFNHILWNTDGSRFMFFHRWRPGVKRPRSFLTRAFTADVDGKNVRIFSEKPGLSHFIWRDPEHILFYREDRSAYVLIKDDGRQNEEVVLEGRNGHCSYLPRSTEWILTDTYPIGPENMQYLYLYNVVSGRLIVLNRFFQPRSFSGKEWRVDLHPRISRDGTKIIIDSTHENNTRQMYMLDISGVIESDRGVIYRLEKKG